MSPLSLDLSNLSLLCFSLGQLSKIFVNWLNQLLVSSTFSIVFHCFFLLRQIYILIFPSSLHNR